MSNTEPKPEMPASDEELKSRLERFGGSVVAKRLLELENIDLGI